jgi:plastocyanin
MYSESVTPSSITVSLKPLIISFLALIVAAALPGCTSTGTDDDDNGTPPPDQVWMENRSFYPQNRTIEEGTTLTWVNRSNEVHTVTSGDVGEHDGTFNSGDMSPDQEFTYTFTETGTFSYFCIPHQPHMYGTITVVEEGSDPNDDY